MAVCLKILLYLAQKVAHGYILSMFFVASRHVR